MKNGQHTLTVLSKAAYVKELMTRDQMAIVYARPDVPGVVLPTHLRTQPFVAFGFDTKGPFPIANLVLDNKGVGADMTFDPSKVAHQDDVVSTCFFPWAAVYAIIELGGKGLMWREDAPAEIESHYTITSHVTDPTGSVDLPIVMGDDL